MTDVGQLNHQGPKQIRWFSKKQLTQIIMMNVLIFFPSTRSKTKDDQGLKAGPLNTGIQWWYQCFSEWLRIYDRHNQYHLSRWRNDHTRLPLQLYAHWVKVQQQHPIFTCNSQIKYRISNSHGNFFTYTTKANCWL